MSVIFANWLILQPCALRKAQAKDTCFKTSVVKKLLMGKWSHLYYRHVKNKALSCISKIGKSKLLQSCGLEGTFGQYPVQLCCTKQGQAEQVAQDRGGWVLNVHKCGDPTVAVFSHPGRQSVLSVNGIPCISKSAFCCHLIKCRALSPDLLLW